jgi:hypothetical protein
VSLFSWSDTFLFLPVAMAEICLTLFSQVIILECLYFPKLQELKKDHKPLLKGFSNAGKKQ